MEPNSQRLTLRLTILESVKENGSLTIDVARGFTALFPPDSDWNATVRQVERTSSQQGTAGSAVSASADFSHPEYEVSLTPSVMPLPALRTGK